MIRRALGLTLTLLAVVGAPAASAKVDVRVESSRLAGLGGVVKAAERRGRRVVLGGHSLGGKITTAYAAWDFGAVRAGGGGGAVRARVHRRRERSHARHARGRPAAARGPPGVEPGGISAPVTGLFNATGSLGVLLDPERPSVGQAFPLLPSNLKPPIPVTNTGQYGYALDAATSPPGLAAAQANLGRLAAGGDPRGGPSAPSLRLAPPPTGAQPVAA